MDYQTGGINICFYYYKLNNNILKYLSGDGNKT